MTSLLCPVTCSREFWQNSNVFQTENNGFVGTASSPTRCQVEFPVNIVKSIRKTPVTKVACGCCQGHRIVAQCTVLNWLICFSPESSSEFCVTRLEIRFHILFFFYPDTRMIILFHTALLLTRRKMERELSSKKLKSSIATVWIMSLLMFSTNLLFFNEEIPTSVL